MPGKNFGAQNMINKLCVRCPFRPSCPFLFLSDPQVNPLFPPLSFSFGHETPPTTSVMPFSFIVLATSLSFALSASSTILGLRQTVPTLPTCADPCFVSPNLGGCAATNYVCLCNNQAYLTSTSNCILQHCTGADLTTTYRLSQATCLAVGVTLSIPGLTSSTVATATAVSPAVSTSQAAASPSPTTTIKSNDAGTPPDPTSPQTVADVPTTTPSATSSLPSSDASSSRVNILAGVAALALAASLL